MLIYFAHPIDQARVDRAINPIRGVLASLGTVYRPGGAFQLSFDDPTDLHAIDDINSAAIYRADDVVAWLPPKVATLGVPAEIEVALAMNKPVVILTEDLLINRSVQLASWGRQGAFILDWVSVVDGKLTLDELIKSKPRPDEPEPIEDLLWTAAKDEHSASLAKGHYHGDAGLDLAISAEVGMHVGEYKLIPTGVHVAIPDGYFGWIVGRSSTWTKYQCQVQTAIIDSGYRGELMIGLHNQSKMNVRFEAGFRLAQMILLPSWQGDVTFTPELPKSHRGTNGYGSSGS